MILPTITSLPGRGDTTQGSIAWNAIGTVLQVPSLVFDNSNSHYSRIQPSVVTRRVVAENSADLVIQANRFRFLKPHVLEILLGKLSDIYDDLQEFLEKHFSQRLARQAWLHRLGIEHSDPVAHLLPFQIVQV